MQSWWSTEYCAHTKCDKTDERTEGGHKVLADCHEVPTNSVKDDKYKLKMHSKAVILLVLSSLIAFSSCCSVKSTSYTTDGTNRCLKFYFCRFCNFTKFLLHQMISSSRIKSATSPSLPWTASRRSTPSRCSPRSTTKSSQSSEWKTSNIRWAGKWTVDELMWLVKHDKKLSHGIFQHLIIQQIFCS